MPGRFLGMGLTLVRRLGLTVRRCPVCGAAMEGREPLCPDCVERLPARSGGYCPTCGQMSGFEDAPASQCSECRLDPPPWKALHVHGKYAGLLRELILGYKFHNNFGRNHLLAELAAATFEREAGELPDLIVPVPLHRRRLLWRGFNQSLELSRRLSRRTGRPVRLRALTRIRNTPPQTRLGLKERQANIKGAFAADPELVRGRRVLLVDDVYTTGSTLRECARTLRRAGASGVSVLVLARSQEEPV